MKNRNCTSKLKKTISIFVFCAVLLVFYSNIMVIKSSALISPTTLTESFDNISSLTAAGWAINNASSPVGTNSWFQGTDEENYGPFNSYSGASDAYIAANFACTTGSTGTISNWLITPQLTIKNGTMLRFYTRKPTITSGLTDYPDRLEVRLSQNGVSTNVGATASSTGDFSKLLLSINPTLTVNTYPQAWTQYTVFINDLETPVSGRFAFRYYVTNAGPTGLNSDYIGIDDVTVESAVSMTDLSSPAAFQAGNAPVITSPEITTNYNAISQGWQIKRSSESSYSSYTQGAVLDASYQGAYLRYSATYNFGTVYSNVVTLTVNIPTMLNLTASPSSPGTIGDPVTFTATVATESNGLEIPTGTVTFYDGTMVIGTPVNLYLGKAELTTSMLSLSNHTIRAVYLSGGNYMTSENSLVYTINRKVQSALSISGKPTTITYGDTTFNLTTQGGSGNGAVTWESDNTDVLTVIANTGEVTIVGAGSAKITARKAEDDTYYATSATIDLTVDTADQQPITIVQNDVILELSLAELQLNITGGSGSGAVIWESSNNNVATVSNTGIVTLAGKGTATITVTKSADGNHSTAVSDSINITVVDKIDLDELISNVLQQKDNAIIGEGNDQYPQIAVDLLNSAIIAAQTVYTDDDAIQSEIDDAYTELTNALNDFLAQVVVVDNANLTQSVAKANEILNASETGDNVGQYPASAFTMLRASYDKSVTVLNSPKASQTDMDTARTELETAVASFLSSINKQVIEEPVINDNPITGDSTSSMPLVLAIASFLCVFLMKFSFMKPVKKSR